MHWGGGGGGAYGAEPQIRVHRGGRRQLGYLHEVLRSVSYVSTEHLPLQTDSAAKPYASLNGHSGYVLARRHVVAQTLPADVQEYKGRRHDVLVTRNPLHTAFVQSTFLR